MLILKKIRIVISMLLVSMMLLPALNACSSGDENEDLPTLNVWVFSDEYKTAFDRATADSLTSIDWQLNTVVVGAEEMELLINGQSDRLSVLPDVFMLSPDDLPRFIESEVTADLGAIGLFYDENRYYSYTVDAGTNSTGILKAACYEPDPGLFFYRRSLAEYYFGTDEPDQIQEMISDWDGFYQTALKLDDLSQGTTRMVMGTDELMCAYLADIPLVSGGKLHISQQAQDFIDFCRSMADEQLMYNASRWSEAWIAGISDPQSVFGYFSSGLGMENILKPCSEGTVNGEGSYGDWAAVPGPAPYNWGGCWLAVRQGSPMTEEALTFIEYFTAEEEAMRTDRLISGSFSANRTVTDQIKFDSQFSESFLSAQNCYSLMAQTADDIKMGSLTPYDSVLRMLFADCVSDYAFDLATREQALADFERSAFAAYPELEQE